MNENFGIFDDLIIELELSEVPSKQAPFFWYNNFCVFYKHIHNTSGQEIIQFPTKAIVQSHSDLSCLYVTYSLAFIPSQG